MTAPDYLADYDAAQAAGHHVDCDGYRTAHRVEVCPDAGGYRAVCADCGPLHVGSFGQRRDCERLHAGHAQEVPCDGRCTGWSR